MQAAAAASFRREEGPEGGICPSSSGSTEEAEEYISAQSSIHSSSSSEQDYGQVLPSSAQAASEGEGDRTLRQAFDWPRYHDVMMMDSPTSSSARSYPSETSSSSSSSPHELNDATEEAVFFSAPPAPCAPSDIPPSSAHRYDDDACPSSQPKPRSRARPRPLILAESSVNLPRPSRSRVVVDPPDSSSRDHIIGPPVPATSSTVQTTTTRVRISTASSSSFGGRGAADSRRTPLGFPFASASSILTTSTSCADLRSGGGGGGGRGRPKRISQGSAELEDGKSMQSHRTSSDVDLDLSFDWQHEDLGGMRGRQQDEQWVGIDMGRLESEVEDRGGMGQEKGKRRVQSAVDIRAAYLAGEKAAAEAEARAAAAARREVGAQQQQQPYAGVAILMDNHQSSTYASPSPDMRASWTRNDKSQDVLPFSNLLARKNIPAPLSLDPLPASSTDPKRQPDAPRRRGYAFNPTDPIEVPLPESPDAVSPSPRYRPLKSEFEMDQSFPRSSKMERKKTRQLSLSSAPSWVPFAGGGTKEEKGKGRAGGQEEDLETSSPRPSSNWAEATRDFLKNRAVGAGKVAHRRPVVTSEGGITSPETSPLFSEGESSRTAPTTPNDTPRFAEFGGPEEEDLDEPVQVTLSRSVKDRYGKGRLHGLGLDMRGSSDHLPSAMDQKPLPPRPQPPPPAPSRPGHVTIPSLSISPPEEDDLEAEDSDEDALSDTSSESAVDPTVSPSRRLSDRSSPSSRQRTSAARVHYGPTPLQQQQQSTHASTATAAQRRLFGSGIASSANLLQSSSRAPAVPSSKSQQFGFTPAPLLLSSAPPTSVVARCPSPSGLSLASLASFYPTYTSPSILLEETVPSKLAFLAGFLLGPWCWILGGWWLRSSDGELTTTRARRCRNTHSGANGKGCGCGRLVAWSAVAHAAEVQENQEERWAGLDKWVFVNRCAALGSGGVVSILVGVAIWAAVVGA